MKILQLNVWGGRIKDGLANFIAQGDFDVVCLQEAVWDKNKTGVLEGFVDTVDKIKKQAWYEHDFRSSNFGMSVLGGEVRYELGNVILSRVPFSKTEEKVIFGEYGCAEKVADIEKMVINHRYTAQKVTLGGLTVLNYHGYWLKNPLGNEVTMKCMRSVADMIRDEAGPVVMCGDLNVTRSAPAMRELNFLTNLTVGVTSTLRNIRFKKDVPCDHILISRGLSYDNFQVIDAPVSDHRGLSVEIKF